ncbi:hypothetical protein TPHA_0E00960 [Tetrapisispora phaffii CBS 4417]|uniref:REM-1 domain-containing protein n=1 Tax=Tetrapisispora phaffii (strain ATCC 24235 / CBS 4417 / NBRC 1672 / NRRL Y-8282 / UCD 70-5) TaxID=1071381 RepID=G8BTG2_TETPH|nr:hypothetical protein TPHA_0E00960 [Tetrapisispora phaffii CBS 4417]CCE63190.1 hypothetical protein TPHA_0E00960 [Tetrapisispora phaffii CBS 4417]
MNNLDSSPRLEVNRSRSDTINTQESIGTSSVSIHSNAKNKNKKNLILSTSFVSSKRSEYNTALPSSPLNSKYNKSTANKTLFTLKNEIIQFQNELIEVKRKKRDAERLKKTTSSNIYSGTYSTNHLEKHSIRIKTNTQIREFDNLIKKLEKQITEAKLKYENIAKMSGIAFSLHNNSIDNLTASYSEEDADGDISYLSNKLTSEISLGDAFNRQISADNSSIHSIQTNYDIEKHISNTPLLNYQPLGENTTINKETAIWLISDSMQGLRNIHSPVEDLIKRANDFILLIEMHPEIRNELALPTFMPSIQALLLHEDKLVVAASFKICRYLINGAEFIDELLSLRLAEFIVISLGKENSYQIEREQALKLVRKFNEYKKLPKSIMQAIISSIEKTDDNMRYICLETLLETCFIDPELVNNCRGMRVLEDLLHDFNSIKIVSIILDTILQLMSHHDTRKSFINDFDISVLNIKFSDLNNKPTTNIDNLQNSAYLISRALKNPDGYRLYSVNNFEPLKQLMSFLQVPVCASYLFDIFLDVLRIKSLNFKVKAKYFNTPRTTSHYVYKECMPINQQVALLITIFHHCDLVKKITNLIDEFENDESKSPLLNKARYFLYEYLNLSMNLIEVDPFIINKYLPTGDKNSLGETFLFEKISYNLNKKRNTIGLEEIDYNRNVKNLSLALRSNALINKVDDLKFRRMVFDSKVLQIKDFSLWNWNIIQELLVGPLMNPKQLEELSKTKFIRKLLVFYRPLRQRFSNVSKKSRLANKYIQVGCQFFKTMIATSEGMKILIDDTKIIPQLTSLLFRAMEGKTDGNLFKESSLSTKLVFGYFKFIGTLTTNSNGIYLLNKWNFFTIIYKMFQNSSKISTKFLMLTLPEIDIMYSSHCRAILGKALVTSDEHVRKLATKIMGTKLRQVTDILLSNNDATEASSPMHTKSEDPLIHKYILEKLTRQLYDLNPEVVAIADEALYEYVVKTENSSQELASWLRTSLNQMVFISSPILFELMSNSYGFQILNEINYIEEERLSWISQKDKDYVYIVEEFLSNYESLAKPDYKENEISIPADKVDSNIKKRLPLHFYGSLAKTDDGINMITSCRDLVIFMDVIKKYIADLKAGKASEKGDDILELKAKMWSCGFIGSTPLGIGLADNYSLTEDFITIAYDSTVTSLRTTAFYVLGLLSKTKEGCEILDELGWTCCLTVFSEPVGIALPKAVDKFLSYKEMEWKLKQEYSDGMITFDSDSGNLIENGKVEEIALNLDKMLADIDNMENVITEPIKNYYNYNSTSIETTPEKDNKKSYSNCITLNFSPTKNDFTNVDDELKKLINEAVTSVCELSNHIIANKAIKNLTEMKQKYANIKLFENEVLFSKVFDIMNHYRFKPNVRKFLMGLFINKKSMRNLIRSDRQKIRRLRTNSLTN